MSDCDSGGWGGSTGTHESTSDRSESQQANVTTPAPAQALSPSLAFPKTRTPRSGSVSRSPVPRGNGGSSSSTALEDDSDVFWFSLMHHRWRRERVFVGASGSSGSGAWSHAAVHPCAELPARTLRGHKQSVRALCVVGPWGETAISGARDKSVRMWSLVRAWNAGSVEASASQAPSVRGSSYVGAGAGVATAVPSSHSSGNIVDRAGRSDTSNVSINNNNSTSSANSANNSNGSSSSSHVNSQSPREQRRTRGSESPHMIWGTGGCDFVYENHSRGVLAVASAAWADRIVSCDSASAHVWSPHTGQAEAVVPVGEGELHSAVASLHHRVLFVGQSDAEVACVDLRAKGVAYRWKVLPESFRQERDAVTALCVSSDGASLVCGTYGGRLGVLDARMGDVTGGWASKEEHASIYCVMDAGKGRVLYASEHRCAVACAATGQVEAVLPTGDHTALDLCRTGNGDVIAANGSSKLYYMPEVLAGTMDGGVHGRQEGIVEVWRPKGTKGALSTSAASALDGSVCVLGCESGRLRIVPSPRLCLADE